MSAPRVRESRKLRVIWLGCAALMVWATAGSVLGRQHAVTASALSQARVRARLEPVGEQSSALEASTVTPSWYASRVHLKGTATGNSRGSAILASDVVFALGVKRAITLVAPLAHAYLPSGEPSPYDGTGPPPSVASL